MTPKKFCHFLDHESIDVKLQSRLAHLATLRAHFTQALDTLLLSYY